MRIKNKHSVLAIILSSILSAFFVLIASYSTSPLYPGYFGYDSAQFQLLGKCWTEGIIPPLDIFDHKGPFIFFVNAIGYYISNSSCGILFVQFVFFTSTLIFLYKIATEYTKNNFLIFVAIFIVVIFLSTSYEGGNLTEEYCLPFLCFSVYCQIKYLNSHTTIHPASYSILYGVTFGICLCTRVTNAIMVCSGMTVIFTLLFFKRHYKNLVCNFLYFIVGVLFVCAPFCIYYFEKDGLYEAFYCAIIANLEYKKYMTSWLIGAKKSNCLDYYNIFFPSYCLFFASFFVYFRKKYKLICYFCLASLLESYLFLSGALYPHYAMIATPQLLLLLCELILAIKIKSLKNFLSYLLFLYCTLFIVVFSIRNISYFINKSNRIYMQCYQNGYEYEELISAINKKDNFVAYGGDSLVQVYIKNKINPCYRYYILQEWHSQKIPKIKNEIIKSYSTCKALWILSDNNTTLIQNILDAHYVLANSTKRYKLWRRK